MENNNMLSPPPNTSNYSRIPQFLNNGALLNVASVNFSPKMSTTTITLLGQSFEENSLIGRIIVAGKKWGIVKSNKGNMIEVWGDFSGEASIRLLPSYKTVK